MGIGADPLKSSYKHERDFSHDAAPGRRVETAEAFASALHAALAEQGPKLIEVVL